MSKVVPVDEDFYVETGTFSVVVYSLVVATSFYSCFISLVTSSVIAIGISLLVKAYFLFSWGIYCIVGMTFCYTFNVTLLFNSALLF